MVGMVGMGEFPNHSKAGAGVGLGLMCSFSRHISFIGTIAS